MDWLIHHGKRIARITAGVVILVAGLILVIPGVPGPGLLVIFIGLSILAVDFVWAHRLKTKIQDTTKAAVDKIRGKKDA
jgi:tellurite resistance protein TerC